ncbi:MAG: hypothetical protein ACYC63_02050 [Armatimonadota bacterium]
MGPSVSDRFHVLLLVALVLCAIPGAAAAAPDHHWQLGHGTYAPYLKNTMEAVGELDLARWDWLVVEIGSEDTIKLMNRLLEINPKLKFLARVWPINGMGDPEHRSAQGTCLDYMLYPQKREEIDRRTRDAIRQLKSNISNWDSIVCLTFLEEIPGAWACGDLVRYKGDGPLPRTLEFHKAAIEKAQGRPLVWDAKTKAWVGEQFVQSMDSLHKLIKQESGGKLVFYWHHTNFATLDDLPQPRPADFDLVKWAGYPVYFKDLVKPGLCDGLMAYPNNAEIWEQKYMRHVRANNWLYYSQLSHPSFMRLCSWPDSVKMVTNKMPQNLGYFLYCEGSCSERNVWNDDQSIPDEPQWNQRRTAQGLHLRHVARQMKVGFDVVKRYQHLRVRLDAKLGEPKAGDVFHLVALVENPKDETYYDDPAEAIARDVKVELSLPAGVIADKAITAPTKLEIGDLPGQGRRTADWWLTVKDPTALKAGQCLTVTATSANTDRGSAATASDISLPSFEAHPIAASGVSWEENGFRNGSLRPAVQITAVGAPIKNPTLTDGINTITFNGELWAGMKLLITPDMKARLYPDSLLPSNFESLKDANDATGYRGSAEGYNVGALAISRYVRPGGKYVLTISGQAADGGNSLVVLRGLKPRREAWMESVLANRFNDKWREASQTVTIPADIENLERLYLYRFQSKGKVWYGPMSLVPADLPAEGLDVSEKLSGRPLQFGSAMMTKITYTDASPDSIAPKVTVQLHRPEDAQVKILGPGQL